MIGFLSLIFRIIIILIAYVAAVLSATLFLAALVAGGFQPQSDQEVMGLSAGMIVAVPVMSSLFGYYSFVPAMVLVCVSEVLGRRDWLFHALGGAFVALLVMVWRWSHEPGSALDSGIASAAVAAGIVGGWIYWLIAGRRAGQPAAGSKPTSSGSSES